VSRNTRLYTLNVPVEYWQTITTGEAQRGVRHVPAHPQKFHQRFWLGRYVVVFGGDLLQCPCTHILESRRLNSFDEVILTGLCYRVQRGEPFHEPWIDRCDVVSRRLGQEELRHEHLVQCSIRFPPRVLAAVPFPIQAGLPEIGAPPQTTSVLSVVGNSRLNRRYCRAHVRENCLPHVLTELGEPRYRSAGPSSTRRHPPTRRRIRSLSETSESEPLQRIESPRFWSVS